MLIILRTVNCSFDTRICGTAKNRLIRKGRATENMTGKRRKNAESENSPSRILERSSPRRKTHGINSRLRSCGESSLRNVLNGIDVGDVAGKIEREAEDPRGGNWKSRPCLFSSDRPAKKLLNRFIMQRSSPHAKTVVKPLALKSGGFPIFARKSRDERHADKAPLSGTIHEMHLQFPITGSSESGINCRRSINRTRSYL